MSVAFRARNGNWSVWGSSRTRKALLNVAFALIILCYWRHVWLSNSAVDYCAMDYGLDLRTEKKFVCPTVRKISKTRWVFVYDCVLGNAPTIQELFLWRKKGLCMKIKYVKWGTFHCAPKPIFLNFIHWLYCAPRIFSNIIFLYFSSTALQYNFE